MKFKNLNLVSIELQYCTNNMMSNTEHVYGRIRWNTVKLMASSYKEQYDSIIHSKFYFSHSMNNPIGGFGDLMRVEVVLSDDAYRGPNYSKEL